MRPADDTWRDRFADRLELADELDRLSERPAVVQFATIALRHARHARYASANLADEVALWACVVARQGNYDDAAVLDDAADAIRELSP